MLNWLRLTLLGASLIVVSPLALAQDAPSDPPQSPSPTASDQAAPESSPSAEATPSPVSDAPIPGGPPIPQSIGGPAGATTGIDPALVDRAITVLEDPATRDQVLDVLRALRAAEAQTDEAHMGTFGPNALLTQPLDWLLAGFDRRATAVAESLDDLARINEQFAFLKSWLDRQMQTDARRAFWWTTLTQVGIVLGVAALVGFGLRRLMRGLRANFETYAPPTPLHVTGALVLHLVVRLIPVGLFVVAAAATALSLDMGGYTRGVTRALVEGLAFVTALTAAVRALLNVKNPNMRLFPVEQETGAAIQHSIILVIGVGGYGFYGLAALGALGLPWTLHAFFEQILFFVTFLLFVRLILRFRALGAEGLRDLGNEAHGGVVVRFLPWMWIARVWHLWAIGFGLVIYGALALDIPEGPGFLLRAIGLTALILFLSRLINVWLSERAKPSDTHGSGAEETDDGEFADTIAKAAQAPGNTVLRLMVTLTSGVLILQAWGIDPIGWLLSEPGAAVRSALVTVTIALAIAYGLWRLASAVIQATIDEVDGLGRPLRSNRSRTLLAIGRNALFVLIWVSVTMLVLSELGVNLAPLLAGAGVIGLAIGFGSQQLVQDIITGFFILIEDTIAVGDIADLGGRAGVVEAISLRTVRLRSYDGQVHTIPFSQIATISNLTKDFSYYVFDIGVAYKEDVDRVMEVMAEVGRGLERDRAFRRLIVAPLEIAGVDAFADSAVMIKARIKTRPLQQWTVGREYNRRLKKRFDELGIEIPFPQRTVHVQTPLSAAAPSVVNPPSAAGS